MAPKRKMEISVVEENERALFSMFQNAANNLSQFYAQSLNQQQVAFEAGQKYSVLKFNEWMLIKLQEGRMVNVAEIIAYLEAKLRCEQGGSGSQPGMPSELDQDMAMDITSVGISA